MEDTIVLKKNKVSKAKLKNNHNDEKLDDEFIINSIEETKGELERLRVSFDFISDPMLIESIIYKERDAVARYEYLIRQARKKGIKVGMLHIYNNACKKY